VVTYLNGFRGTSDSVKNKMTKWKISSAQGDEIQIKLTFADSLWVSQNSIPCFVKLDFTDGAGFKSAGFGKQLAQRTVKRE
jgi:hypothetical protein